MRVDYARGDADSVATVNPSVTRTVQGYLAGEDLLRASRMIAQGDGLGAAALLRERQELFREAAHITGEPRFIDDALRVARLASLTSGPSEPRALALLFETAAPSPLR